MVKYFTIILFFLFASCSSEDTSTDDMGPDAAQTDAGEDLSEICIGLDEESCTNAGCHVVRGNKYDAELRCFLEDSFALCSAAPQCNNGLFFHHTDSLGICWEFNGCTPKEWRLSMESDSCGAVGTRCR